MIVVSDLEGTLTAGATWRGMADYLKTHGKAVEYQARFAWWLPRFMLVRLHLADEQSMKNAWLITLLGMLAGASLEDYRRMSEWVVEREMWPQRRAGVLAEIERQRQAGARVIIASGTFQAMAESFAARIGAEALASEVEVVDGRITGRPAAGISVRGTKARRVQELLGGQPVAVAYGDTESDVPLLELAREAVAVCPDDALRRVAQARGWRIVEPG